MSRAARTPRRATNRDPLVGTQVELHVERVATGGVCVGRLDGRVVFVRHALPGERVRAIVTDGATGSFLRADAVEVLGAPAAGRVSAPCPHARPGGCGGCDWQHAELGTQRALKAEIVREQMHRLAHLDVDVRVEPLPDVAGADGPGLGWRTRVQFGVKPDGSLGLRRSRSHSLERVEDCPLAHARIRSLEPGRHTWPGAAEAELIASPEDLAVVVTPSKRGAEAQMPDLGRGVALLRGDGKGGAEAVRGRPGVREHAIERTWRVSGSGFWQVHPAAADLFCAVVLELLQPRTGEHALDLYSGVGLFAGALAGPLGAGGRVETIESDVGAVADARFNLAEEPSVVVREGRVEDVLKRSGLRSVELVVLDPPRAGAGADVVRWIASLTPRAVAYVSCDPASLARDVDRFAGLGYSLTRLRAFDAFPMTQHVECIALLTPGPA
ncbi:MAG TPA: TRAM domain-containing protein [Mycobacteriales bacterium]|nr:TRAM domain-containing protein [Mycobacteriales bacterium]